MRAFDHDGEAVGFLLRAKCDRAIALRGKPAKIAIDRSGATVILTAGHSAA